MRTKVRFCSWPVWVVQKPGDTGMSYHRHLPCDFNRRANDIMSIRTETTVYFEAVQPLYLVSFLV